jgi:hypothetical protein
VKLIVIGILASLIMAMIGISFRDEVRDHWRGRTTLTVRIAAGNQKSEMGRRAATLTRGLAYLAGAGISGARAGARFARRRLRPAAGPVPAPSIWPDGPPPPRRVPELDDEPNFIPGPHEPQHADAPPPREDPVHDTGEYTTGPPPYEPTTTEAICGICGQFVTAASGWRHDCKAPEPPAPPAPIPVAAITNQETTTMAETTFELSTSAMAATQALADQLAAQMEALSGAMQQEHVPAAIRAKVLMAMESLSSAGEALADATGQLHDGGHGDVAELMGGREMASQEFYGATKG